MSWVVESSLNETVLKRWCSIHELGVWVQYNQGVPGAAQPFITKLTTDCSRSLQYL